MSAEYTAKSPGVLAIPARVIDTLLSVMFDRRLGLGWGSALLRGVIPGEVDG